MEKLDRSVWAAGLCLVAYGVRVGLRASRAEGLDLLAPALPPKWKATADSTVDVLYSLVVGGAGPRPNVRQYHLLYQDAARLSRTLDAAEAAETFERALSLWIAEHARARIFVHAGVVGWKGKAVVVPGPTFAGKSTLVAALVRAGATYFSDEFAVLDRRGRVHPYPRALSIRGEGGAPPRSRTPEELGGRTATTSLPVGLVVDTSYRPGARWRPRRCSPGQGVLALLANTVPARSRPRASLHALGAVAERAIVLKGPRGEAEETAARLLDALPPD